MHTTEELRQHNQEIIELAEVLMALSHHHELRTNPHVCDLVCKFNDKVWMHLVFDDKSLLADLLDHDDPEVVASAVGFRESARDLRHRFSLYVKRWCHNNLSDDHEAFVEESEDIFRRILDRVHTENDTILPLIE